MSSEIKIAPAKTPKLYEAGELDNNSVPMLDVPRRCFNAIVEIVHAKEALPNDQELGGYVRQIINAYKFTS